MTEFAGFARGPREPQPPDDLDWSVRTHVYAAFARSGKTPGVDDLAALTGATRARIVASLRTLADARELVLDGNGDGVRMAHPFSAVPTGYPVETEGLACYANCAWDALGVLGLLGTDGRIRTTCPASGEEIEFGVERRKVVGDDDIVVHLLTPIGQAWDDIGFT